MAKRRDIGRRTLGRCRCGSGRRVVPRVQVSVSGRSCGVPRASISVHERGQALDGTDGNWGVGDEQHDRRRGCALVRGNSLGYQSEVSTDELHPAHAELFYTSHVQLPKWQRELLPANICNSVVEHRSESSQFGRAIHPGKGSEPNPWIQQFRRILGYRLQVHGEFGTPSTRRGWEHVHPRPWLPTRQGWDCLTR